MARFIPLRKRNDPDEAAAFEAVLHDGIPEHLRSTVADFLSATLTSSDESGWGSTSPEPNRQALQQVERELEHPLRWNQSLEQTANQVINDAINDPDFGLELVDHRLQRTNFLETDGYGRSTEDATRWREAAARLMVGLNEAGSAWTVQEIVPNEIWKGMRLVQRVDESVQAAAKQAMASGKAGAHLRRAWVATYGKKPDPSKGFSEAIKAVEVAAGPIVTPNDSLYTLGKIVGEMKANPSRFRVSLSGKGDSGPGQTGDIAPVMIVRLLAQLLFTSQHDRHGNFDPTKPLSVSKEEGEAAVHIAVLLVQWFETGAIAKA